MLATHIATTDRPAPNDTALMTLCGFQYARRDPATLEVWHDGLAVEPMSFVTWRANTSPTIWPVCPTCLTLHQQEAP